MCPKDFVSNRNINDIFEEAPPHLDKLEFVVPPKLRVTNYELRIISFARLRLAIVYQLA